MSLNPASVNATPSERRTPRPGDDLVSRPGVVTMDRAFTVQANPEQVWPWIVQLGKRRAGWYFSRRVERFIPRSRRASRTIIAQWQTLAVGDIIPDYGGPKGYFEVAQLQAPNVLVYRATRGQTDLSWAITIEPVPNTISTTRICLRLRISPVRHRNLARLGELVDIVTVAGMAAGLRERLAQSS